MKILITGSNGVVGRHLASELEMRGHQVWGCDLSHLNTEHSWNPSLVHSTKTNYVRVDVAEMRQMERVINSIGPELIYHAAAEFGRWNGEDFYEQMWRTNVVGTKNILKLQELYKFKLVHFSSSEVYGDWPGEMREDVMEKNEVKQLNDYAISKWVNELQIANAIQQNDSQTVIVRLFNTYGPGEYYSPYRSVICRFIYAALCMAPWVVHRGHSRSSLYLTDAARTLANIVDNFKQGRVYNIASPIEHSIEELSAMIKAATQSVSAPVFFDQEQFTTVKKSPNVDLAIEELGHCCRIPIEEGIKYTVEWMKRKYDL